MAIAGLSGHFDPLSGPTSADFLPDMGHGIIGTNPNSDLTWLTLNPESGSVLPGNSDLITASFNSKDLDKNSLYKGFIVIYSNDPDEPVKSVPVILNTGDPLNADDLKEIPEKFSLEQNFPNPFNPETVIRFSVVETENVKLKIYNIIGQEIVTLFNEIASPGSYEVNWDSKDSKGVNVSSGVYFYSLEQGDKKLTRKMILSR
jgi:hypothetical protein